MKITTINKEQMYELVKHCSSSVYAMYRDDYFAIAKSVDDCSFEIYKDKAVLKFKGVEIYPNVTEVEPEIENDFETTATLYFNGHYDEIYEEHYFDIEVKEEISNPIRFERSKVLLKECGIELSD